MCRQPWLALDTEFMREQTYYPRLCLLQIGTPDGMVACVDPLALPQLDPLLDLIYDPAVTKVFHACHQDMEIFFHLRAALPGPIFDTQVAAPLLGLPAQASYARLVEDVLGEHLEKDQTRTDWSRRPLTAGQLAYAADDVFFLGRLYPVLRERLAAEPTGLAGGRFRLRLHAGTLRQSPEEAWRRIRGTQRMTGQQLAILRSLAGWRKPPFAAATTAWLAAARRGADRARLPRPPTPPDWNRCMVSAPRPSPYGTELLAVIAEGQRAPELPAARVRCRSAVRKKRCSNACRKRHAAKPSARAWIQPCWPRATTSSISSAIARRAVSCRAGGATPWVRHYSLPQLGRKRRVRKYLHKKHSYRNIRASRDDLLSPFADTSEARRPAVNIGTSDTAPDTAGHHGTSHRQHPYAAHRNRPHRRPALQPHPPRPGGPRCPCVCR